jgi:HEAT repeat protein
VRPSLAAWLVLPALLAAPVGAITTDRLALEQHVGESPTDVAFAFLEGCLRLGTAPDDVRPVQVFQAHGKSFVRLAVSGPPLVLRCQNALSGRDAVDGTIHWLDGSTGGLLLSSVGSAHEEVIPDADWITPNAMIPLPTVDESLVDELIRGSEQGREKLRGLPPDAALMHLQSLIHRGGPPALAALERIATTDPRWSVRRSAVLALDPAVSASTIFDRARKDEAWQVRLAGVGQLHNVMTSQSPRAEDAAILLLRVAKEDTDWSVQREAVWSMPSTQVRASGNALKEIVWKDGTDARVRAVTLEALGGVAQLSRGETDRALHFPAEEVRAVGAEILVSSLQRDDVRKLWAALNDPARIVRLAAAPVLYRLDDGTIGPTVWSLYLAEAEQMDADFDFERAAFDLLARRPYPGLAESIESRLLSGRLSPDELRLLSRTLAKIAPNRATQLLQADLGSPDRLKRSIAADALPDNPAAHARRIEFLTDPDPLLRASALLGLCRASSQPLSAELAKAELPTFPLGEEARLAAARCGSPEPPLERFSTALRRAPSRAASNSRWAALLGMGLLLAHVLFTKIAAGPLGQQQNEANQQTDQ